MADRSVEEADVPHLSLNGFHTSNGSPVSTESPSTDPHWTCTLVPHCEPSTSACRRKIFHQNRAPSVGFQDSTRTVCEIICAGFVNSTRISNDAAYSNRIQPCSSSVLVFFVECGTVRSTEVRRYGGTEVVEYGVRST